MNHHYVLNRTANVIGWALFVIVVYLSTLAHNAGADIDSPMDQYQETPFTIDSVTTTIWLRDAPPPSPQTYDGVGNPTVVVTHTGPGGLHRALHEAEVWTETAGGVNACGTTHFLLEEFRVFYPTGGASPSNTNVTYTSDTYGRPAAGAPGNEECALRAEPGKTWHYRVCIEFDGVRSEPRPTPNGTVFDGWDRCVVGESAASSPLYGILGHG